MTDQVQGRIINLYLIHSNVRGEAKESGLTGGSRVSKTYKKIKPQKTPGFLNQGLRKQERG